MGNVIEMDCEVRTMRDTIHHKKDGIIEKHIITLRDGEGVEISIKSPVPFEGFKPEQMIKIKLENTQTLLKEYEEDKKDVSE